MAFEWPVHFCILVDEYGSISFRWSLVGFPIRYKPLRHVSSCRVWCGTEAAWRSRVGNLECRISYLSSPLSRTLISTSVIFQPPPITIQLLFFHTIATHQLHRRILSNLIFDIARLYYKQPSHRSHFSTPTFTTELSSRTSYEIKMSGPVETGDKGTTSCFLDLSSVEDLGIQLFKYSLCTN